MVKGVAQGTRLVCSPCTVGDEHPSIFDAPSCKVCANTCSTSTVVTSNDAVKRRRLGADDDNASAQEGDATSISSESDIDTDRLDESYLNMRTRRDSSELFPTELDEDHAKCRRLRLLLRDRPCLPPDPRNGAKSMDDVDNGVYLPQYSCPFKNCYYHTEDREEYLHHIAGGVSDETHKDEILDICKPMTPGRTALCYISEAIAVAERDNFPKVGLAVTRRVLRGLCQRYCDSRIYAATCFICAQIHTSIEGYQGIDLEKPLGTDNPKL